MTDKETSRVAEIKSEGIEITSPYFDYQMHPEALQHSCQGRNFVLFTCGSPEKAVHKNGLGPNPNTQLSTSEYMSVRHLSVQWKDCISECVTSLCGNSQWKECISKTS